ncbi:MAG: zinc ribbon domain-containing protein [Planctomycetes bacterium]|nr:zinc ribbon domain-containing protein [Planctomycetota bacterium]
MPTYDYLCSGCGHAFEKFQSITASPSKKCPECKKMKLQRLIGAGAGVIFKGSGFYETDYRSKTYTDAKTKAETKPKETEKKTDKPKAEKKKSESKKSSKPTNKKK